MCRWSAEADHQTLSEFAVLQIKNHNLDSNIMCNVLLCLCEVIPQYLSPAIRWSWSANRLNEPLVCHLVIVYCSGVLSPEI